MCRRPASYCLDLGPQPEAWSTRSPLFPKPWFEDSMDAFEVAYRTAVAGDTQRVAALLPGTRDSELNEWFDLHAQNSGTYRVAHYGRDPEPLEQVQLDSVRRVTGFERELFARDGYRCRYCGVRVIPNSISKRMQDFVSPAVFGATVRGNRARHGVKLAFSATLDHVVPHSRGGLTDSANLVTVCWACNYGKAEFTLSEMGLEDPRDFRPMVDGWLGLTDVPVYGL